MTARHEQHTHPLCSGGNRCACYSNTHHEHCICGDRTCVCHSAQAQGLELVRDKDGRELYIPLGARLVRKLVRP